MTEHPGLSGTLVLGSALRRDQYVRLSRLVMWRQLRPHVVQIAILFGTLAWVSSLFELVSNGTLLGLRPLVLTAILIAAVTILLGASAALLWWSIYLTWAGQVRLLSSPGTTRIDGTGVFTAVPGVMDSRVPWGSIEAAVYSQDVLGLRLNRYSYIMVPLPSDPAEQARLRHLVGQHVPSGPPHPHPVLSWHSLLHG